MMMHTVRFQSPCKATSCCRYNKKQGRMPIVMCLLHSFFSMVREICTYQEKQHKYIQFNAKMFDKYVPTERTWDGLCLFPISVSQKQKLSKSVDTCQGSSLSLLLFIFPLGEGEGDTGAEGVGRVTDIFTNRVR